MERPIDTLSNGAITDPPPVHSERWGPWSTLAWGASFAVVLTLSDFLGVLMFLAWWRSVYPDQPFRLQDVAMNGPALAFTFIVSTPIVVAYVGYAVRLSGVSFKDYLALKWPRRRDLLIGFGLLIALLGIFALLDSVTGQETPQFLGDVFDSAKSTGTVWLLALAFALAAPLQEELIFRGFLYRGLSRTWGPVVAILLTSAVWASLHVQYNWYFVAEIFVLGLALGWLRWRSGSMLLTFMLHAFNNGIAVVAAAFMCG